MPSLQGLLGLPEEIQDIIIGHLCSFKDMLKQDMDAYFRLAQTCSKYYLKLYIQKGNVKQSPWALRPHEWFRMSGKKYEAHSRLSCMPFVFQSHCLKAAKTGLSQRHHAYPLHLSYIEWTLLSDLDPVHVVEIGLVEGDSFSVSSSDTVLAQGNELAIVTISSRGEFGMFFESLMPMTDPARKTLPWRKGDTIGLGLCLDLNTVFVTLNGHFVVCADPIVLRGFDAMERVRIDYRRKWLVQLISATPIDVSTNFGCDMHVPFMFDLASLFSSSLPIQPIWSVVGAELLSSRTPEESLAPTLSHDKVQFNEQTSVGGSSYRSISFPCLEGIDYMYIEVFLESITPLDFEPNHYERLLNGWHHNDRMSIGFTTDPCPSPFTLIGTSPNSIGYTSDSVKILQQGDDISARIFGPRWSEGETIGIGYYPNEHIVFFTRNGDRIGPRMFHTRKPIYDSFTPCESLVVSSSIATEMELNVLTLKKSVDSAHVSTTYGSGFFLYNQDPSMEWMSVQSNR